jgi:hypothetical protein
LKKCLPAINQDAIYNPSQSWRNRAHPDFCTCFLCLLWLYFVLTLILFQFWAKFARVRIAQKLALPLFKGFAVGQLWIHILKKSFLHAFKLFSEVGWQRCMPNGVFQNRSNNRNVYAYYPCWKCCMSFSGFFLLSQVWLSIAASWAQDCAIYLKHAHAD